MIDVSNRCGSLTAAKIWRLLWVAVLLGAQAKQEVVNRGWKLPGEYDAAETANVAHASDKILTVWMPGRTEPKGATIGIP